MTVSEELGSLALPDDEVDEAQGDVGQAGVPCFCRVSTADTSWTRGFPHLLGPLDFSMMDRRKPRLGGRLSAIMMDIGVKLVQIFPMIVVLELLAAVAADKILASFERLDISLGWHRSSRYMTYHDEYKPSYHISVDMQFREGMSSKIKLRSPNGELPSLPGGSKLSMVLYRHPYTRMGKRFS